MLAELPLPVAGLLSDAPLEEVVAQSHAIVAAVGQLGCTLDAPFQHLSFLALSVIPSLEAHRSGARRRRPVRARATGRVVTAYGNAWLVTMDDTGTEHERGWLRVEDGLITDVHGGAGAGRAEDLGGAVVTPGFVNTHHHLYQTLTRARAQQADLFTWLKTLYPVWARHRRRDGVCSGEMRPGGARSLRVLDRLRPSLRLPARRHRAGRSGDPCGAASSACASSRHAARWISASPTAGCRPTRSSRTIDDDPRRHRAAAPRSPTARLGADRRRTLLAVLRHDAVDGGVGGARTQARGCSCTRISRRRSRRTPTAASSSTARRSSTSTGSAGSPTTSGARTASTCRTPTLRPSGRPASGSPIARRRTCDSARA